MNDVFPIGSMYGIFTFIWWISFMVHVGSSDGMMQYSYPGNSAIVTLSLQHHVNLQITKYQSL